jgi:hypothetical protein
LGLQSDGVENFTWRSSFHMARDWTDSTPSMYFFAAGFGRARQGKYAQRGFRYCEMPFAVPEWF